MQQIAKILAYVIAAVDLFGEITGNPYAQQVAAWLTGVEGVLQKGGGNVPTFDIGNFVIGPIPIKSRQGAAGESADRSATPSSQPAE